MTEIPPVPFLRKGVGAGPQDGGCIMQIVDFIDRNEWTDKPPCVHPVIRELAIYVNDRLPDDERQKLLDLGPRMSGTAGGDDSLTGKLLGFLARQVYPIYAEWAEKAGYDDKGAVLACIEAAESGRAAGATQVAGARRADRAARAARAAEAADAASAAWAARAADAAEAADAADAAWAARAARAADAAGAVDPLTFLTALLDHYDEITGRTEIEPLDYAPVCEVMEARA